MWAISLFTNVGEAKFVADSEPYFDNQRGTGTDTSVLRWSYQGKKHTLVVGSNHTVLVRQTEVKEYEKTGR